MPDSLCPSSFSLHPPPPESAPQRAWREGDSLSTPLTQGPASARWDQQPAGTSSLRGGTVAAWELALHTLYPFLSLQTNKTIFEPFTHLPTQTACCLTAPVPHCHLAGTWCPFGPGSEAVSWAGPPPPVALLAAGPFSQATCWVFLFACLFVRFFKNFRLKILCGFTVVLNSLKMFLVTFVHARHPCNLKSKLSI